MESYRRDLLTDMAEHRFVLKNNLNAHYPRFNFDKRKKIVLLRQQN